jgi:hypothetical protein
MQYMQMLTWRLDSVLTRCYLFYHRCGSKSDRDHRGSEMIS